MLYVGNKQKAVGKIEGCLINTSNIAHPVTDRSFEARGQAAHRGWTARFEGKMGLVAGAPFFCFIFF